MKSFLALVAGVFIILNPQDSILNIKSSSSEITGKMVNSFYHQDKLQFKQMVNILNKNVFEYYNLLNLYDTDEKRKEFSETGDFKSKFIELEALRSKLTSTIYYLDFEPVFNDVKSIPFKYDKATGCFSVLIETDYNAHYNEPGYLQFDRLLFRYPEGITVRKNNTNENCIDLIDETISFKTEDQAIVSKIEENSKTFRLLFVFSLTETVPVKTVVLTSDDYCLKTDLKEIIAYDSKTGDIYARYKK